MSFDGGYDEQTNDCGPGDADFLPCPSGLPAGPEFRPRDAGPCFLFTFPSSHLVQQAVVCFPYPGPMEHGQETDLPRRPAAPRFLCRRHGKRAHDIPYPPHRNAESAPSGSPDSSCSRLCHGHCPGLPSGTSLERHSSPAGEGNGIF